MAYDLYWISGSPYAWSAMLGMAVKGLPYNSHRLDPGKGEHKTPKYLAMNPRGKVPVLKDDDTVIYESVAILAYLEGKHPAPPLFGSTPQETGVIWQRIFEIVNYAREPLDGGITRPLFQGHAQEAAAAIGAAAPQAHECLAWVDGILARTPYLAGETLSAADVVYLPFVQCLTRAAGREDAEPLNLRFLPFEDTYPHISQWIKRMEALPGYDDAYPPHWRDAAVGAAATGRDAS